MSRGMQPASLGLHQGRKERLRKSTWAGGVTIFSEGCQDHCSQMTADPFNPGLLLAPMNVVMPCSPKSVLSCAEGGYSLCKWSVPLYPWVPHPVPWRGAVNTVRDHILWMQWFQPEECLEDLFFYLYAINLRMENLKLQGSDSLHFPEYSG